MSRRFSAPPRGRGGGGIRPRRPAPAAPAAVAAASAEPTARGAPHRRGPAQPPGAAAASAQVRGSCATGRRGEEAAGAGRARHGTGRDGRQRRGSVPPAAPTRAPHRLPSSFAAGGGGASCPAHPFPPAGRRGGGEGERPRSPACRRARFPLPRGRWGRPSPSAGPAPPRPSARRKGAARHPGPGQRAATCGAWRAGRKRAGGGGGVGTTSTGLPRPPGKTSFPGRQREAAPRRDPAALHFGRCSSPASRCPLGPVVPRGGGGGAP